MTRTPEELIEAGLLEPSRERDRWAACDLCGDVLPERKLMRTSMNYQLCRRCLRDMEGGEES